MRKEEGGSKRAPRARAAPVAIFFIIAVFGGAIGKAQAAADCAPVLARIASLQGSVELRRSQRADWQSADSGSVLCAGDRIRLKERSRAALLMTNESTLRLDQNTTLILAAPEDEKASLMELLSGALHVITRTPRPFKVKTPYVNAGVEGTEFLVGVDKGSARVAVYEGRVAAANDLGVLTLIAGEIALTASNQAPRKERMVRPVDAVQWALYYPNVIDYGLDDKLRGSAAEAALRESVELYRQGRLAEAIDRTDKAPEGRGDPRFLTYRAGLLLLVGRVDEARPELEKALAADPRNSDAHALQAIIAVVQNDKDQALKLATSAVELDPASPAARMALSYAQQARFKLEDAQASVRKAVELNPKSALAWARLAELQMSSGDLDGALASARHAVEIDPQLAKTQSVLGFAHLARFDTRAAKQAFEQAIALDQAEPFARLGLGLAKIREGDLAAGREKIEIAVSLDPGNALIRSYMGKAYYEEKRDKLAGAQFDLAKAYDPRDPTPWFYDAIRKQTDNRPVEALQDLEKSIELNDNRAIYRSRLLLDQDLAARGVSQARIYTDLGFDRLALLEATNSLDNDPGDHSAHRFLADAYAAVPRHDIARASELLQSQLRQPVTSAPIQPELADDRNGGIRVGVLRGIGPGIPGFSEYSRTFDRNGLSLYLDGLAGSQNSRGDQAVVLGIHDRVSFSLGQFHFETDGFGENASLRKDVDDAFVQASVSENLDIQAEYRNLKFRRDEIRFPFDPDLRLADTLDEATDNLRLGARYKFAPNQDLILSGIWQDRRLDLTAPAIGIQRTRELESFARSSEAQYALSTALVALSAGAGHFQTTDDDFLGGVRGESTFDNAYVYTRIKLDEARLHVQLGLSADRFNLGGGARHFLSPKIGIVWWIAPSTVIRAASFRAVKRLLLGNQSVEPTQVAGFNQVFDDASGTRTDRVGIGVDHRLGSDVFIGAEASRRRLSIPLGTDDVRFAWREVTNRAYAYWAMPAGSWSFALSTDVEYERQDRTEEFTGPEGIANLRTWIVPVSGRLFASNGLFFRVTETYVRQEGELQVAPFTNRFETRDRIWLTDFSLAAKLPRRWGQISAGIRNLFDRRFAFVDTDPANPRFAGERFSYVRLQLAF